MIKVELLTAITIGLSIGLITGMVVYSVMNHYELDEDKLREWDI